MNEQWTEQIRQKMADYRQPAPEPSWHAINEALAANRQRARRVALWHRRIAAAAVAIVLLTGGASYLLLRDADTAEGRLTASASMPKDVISSQPVEQKAETETILAVTKAEPIAKARVETPETVAEATAETVETIAETKVETVAETTAMAETDSKEDATVQQNEPMATVESTTSREPKARPTQVVYPKDLPAMAAKGSRLTAKVWLSNPIGSVTPNGSAANHPNYQDSAPLSPEGSYNNSSGITNDAPTQHTVTESQSVSHRQPVRLGIALRYSLGRRWSVESGLTYTQLTADITTTETTHYESGTTHYELQTKKQECVQRLSYVGIPLRASYLLADGTHFGLYATAGGMVEKMVSGRLTKPGAADENISTGPLLLSVGAALGAEYRLGRQLSIYAEPGIDYYIARHSSVPTYYKEHPLSFNLNLGVRLWLKPIDK
ncbi:MAG: outer membrane beta-barrel protein [Prevotella sp.]|nr:outer membrane beta-barrel protein [Prevotella sp.]